MSNTRDPQTEACKFLLVLFLSVWWIGDAAEDAGRQQGYNKLAWRFYNAASPDLGRPPTPRRAGVGVGSTRAYPFAARHETPSSRGASVVEQAVAAAAAVEKSAKEMKKNSQEEEPCWGGDD